jgi:hydrogenase maturation protease
VIVIGLGNEFRHDDAAGLIAARQLREASVAALEHDGDFAALIEKWKGIDDLILIDAVSSGAEAGTLHRINAASSPLPSAFSSSSTHTLGLADAIELSRALGTLPPHVLVFGVEGTDFTPGIGLSPPVERALAPLVQEVLLYKTISLEIKF